MQAENFFFFITGRLSCMLLESEQIKRHS